MAREYARPTDFGIYEMSSNTINPSDAGHDETTVLETRTTMAKLRIMNVVKSVPQLR